MKLRIKGNTVRLRLSQSEVELLEKGGTVYEKTEFGASDFGYRLRANREWKAEFENGTISISVPEEEVANWATTDKVGMQKIFTFEKSSDLDVLIEKDFKCLSPRSDEEGLFPHPKEGQLEC
jgi:hypothetical protein